MVSSAPIRISKKIQKKIAILEGTDEFPITSNKSLVLANCFFDFLNWYYDPNTNRKNAHKKIIDNIELMIQEGLIDRNTKGYEIPCEHTNTLTYTNKKTKTKINYCPDCKTMLKGVLQDG